MQQLLIYMMKVIIISGLLLIYYYAGLRNKRFHYYNRFYLLLTVLLSIGLPLTHFNWFSFSSKSAGTIKMYRIIYSGQEEDFTTHGRYAFNWQQLVPVIIILISVSLLTHLILSIIKIYRLKKIFKVNRLEEFDFVDTNLESAPFSFFKNIFWRNDIKLETECGKQILQHEITHIKQKHSLDKIFIQLLLCFYWINPFFWQLKKELYLIHEFIADEKAVSNNNTAAFAQMLLAARFAKFEYLPAQSIFYSSIKRRLLMLTTSKKTQFSYLRRIMVLPLIAAVLCLSAFTIKNQNKVSSTQKITAVKPFVLVVDAGHGGKDFGAFSNGVYEKDLNLKISEEIKKLSPEYNINVILTRNNDVFMSPPEKVNFTNAQNADAFISVHVNSIPKSYPSKSGMEILVAKKNTDILESSKVLGSAIIQNLQSNFTVAPALLQQQVGIWVLEQSKIPCALIECGYITNANDLKILKQDAKIELMARNILQGVAMYANKSFDKSKLYQLKSSNDDTSFPKQPGSMLQTQPKPLYIVDGKTITKAEFDKESLEPGNIMSVNVWKGEDAINKYGEKGKNGVVEITSTSIKDSSSSILQTETDTSTKPIFTKAQTEPQFPGGSQGWIKFLEANLNANVPAKNNAPKGFYTVALSFLIDENGKVSQIETLTDPGDGTAEEAKRVIAKGPDWIPAIQNGHNVIFQQKQNITFSVAEVSSPGKSNNN